MKVIYVDNNATTMVHAKVFEIMQSYFCKVYGNPSSMHKFGGQVKAEIEKSRSNIAKLIGANSGKIVFTSCGTESNSSAIYSAIKLNPGKKHIITTRVEHPSIKNLCEYLSKYGYNITFVPVNANGELDTDYLYNSITEDTFLVSIMWSNNETGVIFPVEEISRKITDMRIIFHTDAVQAVGKIPIDMSKNSIDMLSLSGHKIHAPKGIGALYLRNSSSYRPFLIGGHQEDGNRAGTENVASIIGLGEAARISKKNLIKNIDKVEKLRDKLETTIVQKIPNSFINGFKARRMPNTSSISFEHIEGESILLMLDKYGICASSGSACTSGSLEPSHVLKAMKVPISSAHGSVRFSLSPYNTEGEIDYIIDKLPKIVKVLRKISPFWD